MQTTPKSLRITIGLFGRQNVGKSSVVNTLTRQPVSIVSPVKGTTTDPVEKAMELLPLGPVLFIDTAGVDDEQEILGALRAGTSHKMLSRCDCALLVYKAGAWGEPEEELLATITEQKIPVIVVANKADCAVADAKIDADDADAMDAAVDGDGADANDLVPALDPAIPQVLVSAKTGQGFDTLFETLLATLPESVLENPALVRDLVNPGDTVVLVIPIDKEAPKGRLIMPQMQTARDLLDGGALPYLVRDTELETALASLKEPPALVITDSQAFKQVAHLVPDDVPLTGFSVVMARAKGDLTSEARALETLAQLTGDAHILIAEACTHHPISEDIGTVKIPRLLRQALGDGIAIDHAQGKDFPDNLADYDLVIHCGGCMLNRRTMLSRIQACAQAGVPLTNYGLVLAYFSGIAPRALKPFAALLDPSPTSNEAQRNIQPPDSE